MTLVPFRELLVTADSVVAQLQANLEPRLVTVIGACFRGHLYSVDSRRIESFGVQAHYGIPEIDADVDFAVIATSFPMELQAVEDCIQKVEASTSLA